MIKFGHSHHRKNNIFKCIFLNKNILSHAQKRQAGAVTLLMTITLVTMITLIVFFAASMSIMQSKISSNTSRANEALTAADAGMEYGISYLKQNKDTVWASASAGFINYTNPSITNVTLANGSKYSITYTNLTNGNFNLLNIASVGISSDGAATRTVNQLVQYGSMVLTTPTVSVTSKGSVTLAGSAQIYNSSGPTTVLSGSTVTMSGSSATHPQTGTGSKPGTILPDIQQNNAALAGQSNNDMFASSFGIPAANAVNNVDHYYSSQFNSDYSAALNGMIGTSIWINQTSGSIASLTGTVTIGSLANPVLMVVNGNLRIAGNTTIYGLVYVLGNTTTDVTGTITIKGGLITTGTTSLTGSATVGYDPTALANMKNQTSMRYYAKVDGSWRDF